MGGGGSGRPLSIGTDKTQPLCKAWTGKVIHALLDCPEEAPVSRCPCKAGGGLGFDTPRVQSQESHQSADVGTPKGSALGTQEVFDCLEMVCWSRESSPTASGQSGLLPGFSAEHWCVRGPGHRSGSWLSDPCCVG